MGSEKQYGLTHREQAEYMLDHLGKHQDPRNPGYEGYATVALAHAVLSLKEPQPSPEQPSPEED